ncbi:HGL071Wp [Eremothecium sinecaudum]|uniref:HGL071Wp n=1 Tax=Eremothecium sinecaudum TaxID=45286 RepID=A0A0X8HVN0_9SACH|nr:HGL071Wp [Eremothecium sinecaudum]AMD22269.1 HGL071Wp [Eremothecium sinecaudum]
MADDSHYTTPHEAALAIVATAMKKSRLSLDTLLVNSTVGGILFSAGSMLFLAGHAGNLSLIESNPGLLDFLGAVTFVIGLFFVVMNGADLFNSNILFFSVALLRNAVSIYDLIVSWVLSWACNLIGTLFVCYVICHLSGVSSSADWVTASRLIVDQKAAHSFIETFIRGIAGNFFVSLAVYLQLMAKPPHVKLIIMVLPIFTFVAMGFTHVVADMYLIMMGMINGANLSVGRYIWALLLPSTLGNIVGGFIFSAIVPFYLHIIVVERDRKRLYLPEYAVRDEQTDVNVDSRVVRINSDEGRREGSDGSEKSSSTVSQSSGMFEAKSQISLPLHLASGISTLSEIRLRGTRSEDRSHAALPIRGIKTPLASEVNLHNAQNTSDKEMSKHSVNSDPYMGTSSIASLASLSQNSAYKVPTTLHNDTHENTTNYDPLVQMPMQYHPGHSIDTNVTLKLQRSPSTSEKNLGHKLQKTISSLTSPGKIQSTDDRSSLPLSNQECYKFVPGSTPNVGRGNIVRSRSFGQFIKAVSKPFKAPASHDIHEIYRRLSEAGITSTAARASDNIAGVDNYEGVKLPQRDMLFKRNLMKRLSYPDAAALRNDKL